MIKNELSIKDLENLSGIKSHTIRIWEKRYNLLEPTRTQTNIRKYDDDALKKILNVSYLRDQGVKISTIAGMQDEEIELHVREHAQFNGRNNYPLQQLKLAMLGFNVKAFDKLYKDQLAQQSFKSFFYNVIIPFLEELGHLWHSNTIQVSHEHFIGNLIRQKLIKETEKIQDREFSRLDKLYVLYLPENEMHDLGLLFLNYELLDAGFRTIYLGTSMNLKGLENFKSSPLRIVYICYGTIEPMDDSVEKYIQQSYKEVLAGTTHEMWFLGTSYKSIEDTTFSKRQLAFRDIKKAVEHATTH